MGLQRRHILKTTTCRAVSQKKLTLQISSVRVKYYFVDVVKNPTLHIELSRHSSFGGFAGLDEAESRHLDEEPKVGLSLYRLKVFRNDYSLKKPTGYLYLNKESASTQNEESGYDKKPKSIEQELCLPATAKSEDQYIKSQPKYATQRQEYQSETRSLETLKNILGQIVAESRSHRHLDEAKPNLII